MAPAPAAPAVTGTSEASIGKLAMEALEAALELPSDDRRAAIAARTDLPEAVRELALQLLDADGNAIRTGAAGASLPADETRQPAVIGYRILRQLGRGGMGTVWLAERTSRDFDHKVAIKVIKPGVLVDTMVERFRRERQILAQLNHPNIAILHDGGETDSGEPFIVMEYVPGQTLREWLAGENRGLERRLDLFQQVAGAVAFAHQHLIIHRDLTPGNVLVKDDGQAKLIDFGIARLQADENEPAAVSAFSGLSLTPGFAAPERSSRLAANTLSDVYSLGRILDVMTRPLREPELQAIADKASATDPANRYPGAGELIEEVVKFRDKRPIDAYSTSRAYRLARFVARQKALVAVTGAALVGLLVALGATLLAYGAAERSRLDAEQRFNDLRALANYQLFDLYDKLDNVVGNTAARAALAEGSQGYLLQLAESRPDDPQLQLETARGFLRLARIQGLPAAPNLGEGDKARANLDRAEALLVPLVRAGTVQAKAELARLSAYKAISLLHYENLPAEAKASIEQAYALLEEVPGVRRDWNWQDARRMTHAAALEVADMAVDTPQLINVSDLLEADQADWPSERRDGYEGRFDRARAQYYRAIAAYNAETPEGYRRAQGIFAVADRQYGALEADFPNDPHILYWRAWNAYFGYGNAARAGDRTAEAALLRQARASTDQLLLIEENDDSVKTLSRHLKEAQAQLDSNNGRHVEAITLMEELLADERARRADSPPGTPGRDFAYMTAVAGTIYRKAGKRDKTCASFTEALRQVEALRKADQLPGYLEQFEPGLRINRDKCRAGAPVSALGPLIDGSE